MFKFRLPTLFIALLTLATSNPATAQILRSVAYEEISEIMIAQIILSDDSMFIHTTLKNQSSEMLNSWDEGDTIIVSSSLVEQGGYHPSHEITLVNETKNQSLLASATEETIKALPKIHSISFENVKHFFFFTKEKALIGLSNGVFYQTEDDKQVCVAKYWEPGDHVIVSDLVGQGPIHEYLIVNLNKPSAYKSPLPQPASKPDYRKLVVQQL